MRSPPLPNGRGRVASNSDRGIPYDDWMRGVLDSCVRRILLDARKLQREQGVRCLSGMLRLPGGKELPYRIDEAMQRVTLIAQTDDGYIASQAEDETWLDDPGQWPSG